MVRRAGYEGAVSEGVERYLGIPYAAPGPGGRFAPSVRAAAGGQLGADRLDDVPVFPQLPSQLAAAMGPRVERNPQSEAAFRLRGFSLTSTTTTNTVRVWRGR